jgi:hypothetical protein
MHVHCTEDGVGIYLHVTRHLMFPRGGTEIQGHTGHRPPGSLGNSPLLGARLQSCLFSLDFSLDS